MNDRIDGRSALDRLGGQETGIQVVKGGALENLLNGLGIREDTGVQDALVVYSGDDRIALAVHKIRSGQMKSLAACFTTSGINHREFLQVLEKVQVAQALGRALRASLTTNEDMAEDARSRQTLCARCDGLKVVPCEDGDEGSFVDRVIQTEILDKDGQVVDIKDVPVWRRKCPQCDGSGKIRAPGDHRSRQMILEQAGLLHKGPAVQVNVQNYAGLGLQDSPAQTITLDVQAEGE